jgi:hypothetical protein
MDNGCADSSRSTFVVLEVCLIGVKRAAKPVRRRQQRYPFLEQIRRLRGGIVAQAVEELRFGSLPQEPGAMRLAGLMDEATGASIAHAYNRPAPYSVA